MKQRTQRGNLGNDEDKNCQSTRVVSKKYSS